MIQKHPMQPVVIDDHGIARFKENSIVAFLLAEGGFDLNDLALRYFPDEDREQFSQLIGYSVSGFGDLSYASDDAINAADAEVDRLFPTEDN